MNRLLPLILLALLCSCVTQSYEVQSVCEVTDVYNYVVKWEVNPHMDGDVIIYSSQSPEEFDRKNPVGREKISKGRADLVIKGSLNRCYFLLCFPDNVETVVGVRSQKFSSVENFRDLGGYQTMDQSTVKWGKLYRSGNFDSISDINAKRVSKMNVRTFIDLRRDNTNKSICQKTGICNYYHFSIGTHYTDPLPLIYRQQFKRGDAIIFMQDVYREMVNENTESFRQIFDLLLDEKNYPVVFSCRYGNLQASILSALLLSALDVSESVIMEDYLLSNKFFNMRKFAQEALRLPLESQDAITSMMLSDERYLASAIEYLKRRYGSVQEYLETELLLDVNKRNRLKIILLD